MTCLGLMALLSDVRQSASCFVSESMHRILTVWSWFPFCQELAPKILIECLKQIREPPLGTAVEVKIVLFKNAFDILLNYGGDIYELAPKGDPSFQGFTVNLSLFFSWVNAPFLTIYC